MKKVLGVLCCVIIGSAFGSDSQSVHVDQVSNLCDKKRFLENMLVAAEEIGNRGIGNTEMQELWKGMKTICRDGVDKYDEERWEEAEMMMNEARRVAGNIQNELDRVRGMSRCCEDRKERICSWLTEGCIDACLDSVLVGRGNLTRLIKDLCKTRDQNIEKIKKGEGGCDGNVFWRVRAGYIVIEDGVIAIVGDDVDDGA